jgi:hypothetical protein
MTLGFFSICQFAAEIVRVEKSGVYSFISFHLCSFHLGPSVADWGNGWQLVNLDYLPPLNTENGKMGRRRIGWRRH